MIIDAHTHMWDRKSIPDEVALAYVSPIMDKLTSEDSMFRVDSDEDIPFEDFGMPLEMSTRSMDVNGIDHSVVLITDFGLIGSRMDIEEYTDWVFTRCSADDRFLPFIGVDPNRSNACELLRKLTDRYEPLGVKMYPATGFYPDDPKYDEYWDTVEDLGLVVTTHAGMAFAPMDEKYCHPANMRRVAEDHPDTKFIIAHLGGKFHDELFPLMEACDNVYSDCSALQGWWPDRPDMVHKRLGDAMSRFPDRIVFGSDFPLYEERFWVQLFIELIRKGDWCTDALLEKLMGGNMARVLGI